MIRLALAAFLFLTTGLLVQTVCSADTKTKTVIENSVTVVNNNDFAIEVNVTDGEYGYGGNEVPANSLKKIRFSASYANPLFLDVTVLSISRKPQHYQITRGNAIIVDFHFRTVTRTFVNKTTYGLHINITSKDDAFNPPFKVGAGDLYIPSGRTDTASFADSPPDCIFLFTASSQMVVPDDKDVSGQFTGSGTTVISENPNGITAENQGQGTMVNTNPVSSDLFYTIVNSNKFSVHASFASSDINDVDIPANDKIRIRIPPSGGMNNSQGTGAMSVTVTAGEIWGGQPALAHTFNLVPGVNVVNFETHTITRTFVNNFINEFPEFYNNNMVVLSFNWPGQWMHEASGRLGGGGGVYAGRTYTVTFANCKPDQVISFSYWINDPDNSNTAQFSSNGVTKFSPSGVISEDERIASNSISSDPLERIKQSSLRTGLPAPQIDTGGNTSSQNIAFSNSTRLTVKIYIKGTTSKAFALAPGEEINTDVEAGDYEIAAEAVSGSKTASIESFYGTCHLNGGDRVKYTLTVKSQGGNGN